MDSPAVTTDEPCLTSAVTSSEYPLPTHVINIINIQSEQPQDTFKLQPTGDYSTPINSRDKTPRRMELLVLRLIPPTATAPTKIRHNLRPDTAGHYVMAE